MEVLPRSFPLPPDSPSGPFPITAGRSITLSQTHCKSSSPDLQSLLDLAQALPPLAHLPISPVLTTSSHAALLPVLALSPAPPCPPTDGWFPPAHACGLSSCHLLRGVMLMAEPKVAS